MSYARVRATLHTNAVRCIYYGRHEYLTMTELTEDQLKQAANFYIRSRETYALIGEFMWHFAMLEDDLNKLLGRMMGLETVNSQLLVSHIDFARKVNLAICGMPYQLVDHEEAIKVLTKIHDVNTGRKIVAHCLFGPAEEGGAVEFHRTTTNKKL
jgi:hypothetical protein